MNAQITLPIVKEHLRTIEKAFGREWLESKKAGLNHSSKKAAHGVPRLWREISAVYKNALHSGELLCTPNLVDLITLGDRLSQTCALPNFDTCIQPRLRNPLDYESVLYEMQVASTMSSFGYTTSFTPVSRIPNEHTADIQIDFDDAVVYVECKKKDKYSLSSAEDNKYSSTLNDLGAAVNHFLLVNGLQYKVEILSMGLIAAKDIAKIAEAVQLLIADDYAQSHVDRELGCVFKITNVKTPSPTRDQAEIGVFHNGCYSSVTTQVLINGDDTCVYSNPQAVDIYHIDWHKLSSVINSFITARGQVPKCATGIIYIDLDVSFLKVKSVSLSQTNISLYLELAEGALKTMFSPKENTRVSAIVLTAGPNYIGQGCQLISEMITTVVRNPYASLPTGFIIPGEVTSNQP